MYDAVVLGAGVVGLSIARELHEKGLKVAVVARDLPEDAGSVGFASPWAGCNWYSFAEAGDIATKWDTITYNRLARVAADHPDLCEMIPFMSVWSKDKGKAGEPWFKHVVQDYQKVRATSDKPLPGGNNFGNSFNSYVINAPNYLAHLGQTVRALGIPLIRARVSSLDEAYNLPGIGRVNLVVNATGLGSKSLIGVEDAEVYAARGQTVLVKAPLVKTCIMDTDGFNAPPTKPGEKAPPEPAYIIPRPGPEGHVVLGGTYLKNVWETTPDLSTAQRILRDCFNLCPELAGPPAQNGKKKTWQDIEVVAHNVGLRPARNGGPRLELVERRVGENGGREALVPKVAHAEGDKGRKVAVIHAYGIGSTGFLSSMGMAEHVTDLALDYLKSNTKRTRAKL
ncbi:hypothetical protein IAT40_002482 [Kwoniella sp. CBS 6097]